MNHHHHRLMNAVASIWFTVLLLLLALSVVASIMHCAATASTSSSDSVASQFKAPNADTPPDLVQKWKAQDEELWAYVNQHVPAVLDHTGASAFDEHLKGVQAVLRYWDAEADHLHSAGLFHSIYGTEGFQGFKLPLSERGAIQKMIGAAAEKLCFVFCMVDRSTLDDTVFAWKPPSKNNETSSSLLHDTYTLYARPELGRFAMQLNTTEWLDFVELTLADWLEQVEGAATKEHDIYLWKTGQAYSYRRLAYRQMQRILATERSERGLLDSVAPSMYHAVMDTESSNTRHLVQPRTPPVSAAAVEALEALRAAGEDIPLDMSPQVFPEEEEEPSCAKKAAVEQ